VFLGSAWPPQHPGVPQGYQKLRTGAVVARAPCMARAPCIKVWNGAGTKAARQDRDLGDDQPDHEANRGNGGEQETMSYLLRRSLVA
jgi:hypothetical protein